MSRKLFAVIFIIPVLFFSNVYSQKQKSKVSQEKIIPGFYNEILKFSIEIKGISMGSILMRTVKTGNRFLQIQTKVNTLDSINTIYYISGKFGAMWDFKNRKSYIAYEDVYDGYNYLNRAYRFQGDNQVFVSKREVRFDEAGIPHSENPVEDNTVIYFIDSTEFQDLLGVFYSLRTSGIQPNPGEVYNLKVLPAGVKKIMIIQVIEKKNIDVPALGGKIRVVHVKSGISNPGQKPGGGDIFFNVQSALDLYFTDDENHIPVRIWAKVPIIERADVVLTDYEQTGKRKTIYR